MKKKMVILFATSIVTASMLSACGTSTKQADSSSAPATTSSSSQASAPAATSSSSQTPAPVAKAANNQAPAGKTVEVKVMAKDFEFDKKEIRVKKGDKVKITLMSDDGGHGFEIPDYKVNIKGNGSAEFVADKAGTFQYDCSVMCGSGHDKMTGKLIVE
ncbi:cupredoxin domain-containing protein [Aneurinibacillus uraniidurans]|uniref:cupredoxin domain-containing protein n=1 Tax=Aneurinibacillus uraniidurans TaxID=2966586 RepID=UPI002348F172|nr:cupredoxin domain-containing protein [Aneurinibacillus sp. B1]WCN37427.1 cupredoxin domain-containing protein [Aneurinibacillus sp. B1]